MDYYYEYKLNLSPEVLRLYTPNDKAAEKTQLLNTVIPNSLIAIFGEQAIKKHPEYLQIKIGVSEEEIRNSLQYQTFIEATNKLEDQYHQVIANTNRLNGIFWPQEFLSTTKTEASNSIRNLINTFPVLGRALDEITDDQVINDLRNTGQYGHGRLSIIRTRKIKFFIRNNLETISSENSVYYLKQSERFFIKASLTPQNANTIALQIETKINESQTNSQAQKDDSTIKKSNIGLVTINPVFDHVEIQKSFKTIELDFVYPNGKKQTDERFGILKLSQDANAKKSKVILTAPDGQHLLNSAVTNFIQEPASQGYLKSATSGKKNILTTIPKIIHHKFEEILHG